ncbi:MAG: hypothetical protein HQK65_20230 [Desulfamplus sp.]|nr:hypothetical protein [Desulfamplus sp.]
MDRFVRVLEEDNWIHRYTVEVWCWMCSLCYKTFRHLPPFVEPYKRYVTPTIHKIVSRVIDRSCWKYRKSVLWSVTDSRRLGHFFDDQGLAHSSVWWWVVWMSKAMKFFLQHNPKVGNEDSILAYEKNMFSFPSERYRSAERLNELHRARWLKNHGNYWKNKLPRKRNGMF